MSYHRGRMNYFCGPAGSVFSLTGTLGCHKIDKHSVVRSIISAEK